MAGGAKENGGGIIGGINVTPLVDITLVLLIIFMVTAPLMTVGVPVDLPKTSAAEVTVVRGALLGELALLTETTRPVTATAAEPSTVIRVPRGLFLKMLEGFPDAALRLRDYIAARTDQATRDMVELRGVLDPDAATRR